MNDDRLVSYCVDVVRWSAQLPILEFDMVWDFILEQLLNWDERKMHDYFREKILFVEVIDMALYKNIENISVIEGEEEEDQREVWNAHWRGYWDQLTPGYGGYLQNVIESRWNSIKHHTVQEVVHRDITTFIEEMDLKHRTLANAGKYEQIHYMLPFEPLRVFVVGKGNMSHKYIDISGIGKRGE